MKVKDLLQKGFWTLLARSLGAGLMLLMAILFSRWLGVKDSGLFSLGLTVMTVFGVIARWGTDQVILKKAGVYWIDRPDIAKGHIVSLIKIVSFVSACLTFVIVVFHEDIAVSVFSKPEFAHVLLWFGLMTIPFSINYTIAESYKGVGKPVISSYLQNVVTPFMAIFSGMALFHIEMAELPYIVQSFGLGVVIALICSLLLWKGVFSNIKKTNISLKNPFKEGWPMLLITSGALVMAWSDMLILGVLGSTEELGIYSAASRTAMVSTLFLMAMNSITAPKYAYLYKAGNINELKRLALNSTKILIVMALFPTFILLVYPEWVMSLYGYEFISGAPILIVLAIGQFVNVASGSVAYLLIMTGNEK